MMKRNLGIGGVVLIALALGGCGQTVQPALDRYHVVLAPESMYNCPIVKKYPAVKTLSDLQVARVLLEQAEANKICATSMASLRNFYERAKRNFEQANPGQKV